MINDSLKVLELPSLSVGNVSREDAVRILFEKRKDIEEFFIENEYIKLDITNREIIGLKSTAKLGKMEIGDLPAIDFVIRNSDKYKNSNMLNLGNVNVLFQETKNTNA